MSQGLNQFLTYEIWSDAKRLLDAQIAARQTNRHFNTIDIFHYERTPEEFKERVGTEEYFKQKIHSRVFYALTDEFCSVPYIIPKSHLGIRQCRLISYPARVLFYAVGVYIANLSNEFITNYYNGKNILKNVSAYYGGQMRIGKDKKVTINRKSIWYREQYKKFNKEIRSKISGDQSSKVVLHIDIQNFYENVCHRRLLSFLDKFIKPGEKKTFNFNPVSSDEIISTLDFLSDYQPGLPQMGNDLVSNFLAFMYLIPADFMLDETCKKNDSRIESFHIIRYVDDIYLVLKFKAEFSKTNKEKCVSEISGEIADRLYYDLGLRLNTKTRLYWLENSEDLEALESNIKNISPGHEISEEDESTPQDKIDMVLNEIRKLKASHLDSTFSSNRSVKEEILKYVYDESVANLMKSSENLQSLRVALSDFNYELITANSKPITVIISYVTESWNSLREFLKEKTCIDSRDASIMLEFLCQSHFDDEEMIENLMNSRSMGEAFTRFHNSARVGSKTGYFSLTNDQIKLLLIGNDRLIEQIRLRQRSEVQQEYSAALNHLLSELQTVCEIMDDDSNSGKKYEADRVIEFLTSFGISHETCIQARNLFDRRNKNPVSHADEVAWSVSEDEYLFYRDNVGRCLRGILQGNNVTPPQLNSIEGTGEEMPTIPNTPIYF